MSWVDTDAKWWCNGCLAFREGDRPSDAPRATAPEGDDADERADFLKLVAFPIGALGLIVGGAVMIQFGWEKAGWVMIGVALIPILLWLDW